MAGFATGAPDFRDEPTTAALAVVDFFLRNDFGLDVTPGGVRSFGEWVSRCRSIVGLRLPLWGAAAAAISAREVAGR